MSCNSSAATMFSSIPLAKKAHTSPAATPPSFGDFHRHVAERLPDVGADVGVRSGGGEALHHHEDRVVLGQELLGVGAAHRRQLPTRRRPAGGAPEGLEHRLAGARVAGQEQLPLGPEEPEQVRL